MVSEKRTNDFASPFAIAVVYAATLWGLQGEITSVLEDGENVTIPPHPCQTKQRILTTPPKILANIPESRNIRCF